MVKFPERGESLINRSRIRREASNIFLPPLPTKADIATSADQSVIVLAHGGIFPGCVGNFWRFVIYGAILQLVAGPIRI